MGGRFPSAAEKNAFHLYLHSIEDARKKTRRTGFELFDSSTSFVLAAYFFVFDKKERALGGYNDARKVRVRVCRTQITTIKKNRQKRAPN